MITTPNTLLHRPNYWSSGIPAPWTNIPPGTTGSRASLLSPLRRPTWRGSTSPRPGGWERDWVQEGRKDHSLYIYKHIEQHGQINLLEPIKWCCNKNIKKTKHIVYILVVRYPWTWTDSYFFILWALINNDFFCNCFFSWFKIKINIFYGGSIFFFFIIAFSHQAYTIFWGRISFLNFFVSFLSLGLFSMLLALHFQKI